MWDLLTLMYQSSRTNNNHYHFTSQDVGAALFVSIIRWPKGITTTFFQPVTTFFLLVTTFFQPVTIFCQPMTTFFLPRDNFISTRDNFCSIRDNFLPIYDNFLSTDDNFLSIHDNLLSVMTTWQNCFHPWQNSSYVTKFSQCQNFGRELVTSHSHACVHTKMALPGRCVFRNELPSHCPGRRIALNLLQFGLWWSRCPPRTKCAAKCEQNVGDSPSFWTKTWQFSSHLSRKTHLPSNAIFLWTHAWLWLVTSSLPNSKSFGTA